MNNIDELIELNLYEPISRYLTVLEEENDIIKNLTIKIIYVFLTIFLYLLKCPQSLIL